MTFRYVLMTIVALQAGLAVHGRAAAQLAPDATEPVDISSETLDVVDNVATFRGNVVAVQGEAILTAPVLVATTGEDGGFQTIEARENMRYSNGRETISGKTGLYNALARTITVTGDVVVTQGKQVMTGGALVYSIDTGAIRFTAPGGKRIRGIFHTNEQRPGT